MITVVTIILDSIMPLLKFAKLTNLSSGNKFSLMTVQTRYMYIG